MSDLTDSRKRKITDVDSLHSETESNKKARTVDPPSGADDICNICRKDTDLLYCLGACRRAYHRSCLNLAPDHTAHYYCNECINNTRTCFICHDTSDPSPPQKCCLLICGKFYHENCVRSNSLTKTGKESGTFICPRHVCQVCRGEGAKSDQPLLYCFDCCAAYHASCQPDIDVLSHMYCLCGKCQRVKSVNSGAEQPSMTPVTINAASTAYNNPLDPRLPSYKPNLIVELTNQVPVEPVPLAASSVDEGELVQSELALPTDSAEIERLASMDEWDLLDMGYSDAQVKELKQRVTPPPSRGGFRGRGRGRGSFDGSRDSFRSRNRNSREKDKPRDLRDSRSYSSHTSDRRSPSPSRSRHSPYHTSRTWSDRTPSPHSSSHRRSPSPLRSSRTYRDKSPDSRDRDKSRYSHRYSPPPPPSPAPTLAPPPPPQPASVELTTSKVQQSYQPLTAAPLLELTKHNKLICVLDMITVSGPKLEMPAQLELMSVVPVNIVKTIAANTSIIKTVIKLTPRPGSEAQCENLLYYLHQSGKAELFTLTTRHKVFVFSNKEDFITDLTFKRDPVCLMAIGLYQTDLNFL